MDFEQQKPITDEYRRGWERIYLQQEARKAHMGIGEVATPSVSKTESGYSTIPYHAISFCEGDTYGMRKLSLRGVYIPSPRLVLNKVKNG
jgi:hypothetical protein